MADAAFDDSWRDGCADPDPSFVRVDVWCAVPHPSVAAQDAGRAAFRIEAERFFSFVDESTYRNRCPFHAGVPFIERQRPSVFHFVKNAVFDESGRFFQHHPAVDVEPLNERKLMMVAHAAVKAELAHHLMEAGPLRRWDAFGNVAQCSERFLLGASVIGPVCRFVFPTRDRLHHRKQHRPIFVPSRFGHVDFSRASHAVRMQKLFHFSNERRSVRKMRNVFERCATRYRFVRGIVR